MFTADILQGATVLVAAVAFLIVTVKGTTSEHRPRRS